MLMFMLIRIQIYTIAMVVEEPLETDIVIASK